jgi:MoaA/NifB/PqqE/SkfB family radical SAM enzyme
VTDQPIGDNAAPAVSSSLPILTRIGNAVADPSRVAAKVATLGRKLTGQVSSEEAAQWDEQKYLRVIERFSQLPYAMDVRIGVGGETFINKTVVEGARRLSNHDNTIAVNLISNLSFSFSQYEKIFQGFDLSRVAMVCSFHPTEIKDPNRWMETAADVNRIVDLAIVLVAWPPLMASLKENKRRLEDLGLEVFVQAFHGWYDEQKYPETYSASDRELLREVFYSQHDFDHMVQLKQPGACYAGVDYVYVDINGNVSRCGTYKTPMGNLFDQLRLAQRPAPCPGTECWCDTENLNTVEFREHYELVGLNQHKYRARDPVAISDASRKGSNGT